MLQTDQNQGMADRDWKMEEKMTVKERVGELTTVYFIKWIAKKYGLRSVVNRTINRFIRYIFEATEVTKLKIKYMCIQLTW